MSFENIPGFDQAIDASERLMYSNLPREEKVGEFKNQLKVYQQIHQREYTDLVLRNWQTVRGMFNPKFAELFLTDPIASKNRSFKFSKSRAQQWYVTSYEGNVVAVNIESQEHELSWDDEPLRGGIFIGLRYARKLNKILDYTGVLRARAYNILPASSGHAGELTTSNGSFLTPIHAEESDMQQLAKKDNFVDRMLGEFAKANTEKEYDEQNREWNRRWSEGTNHWELKPKLAEIRFKREQPMRWLCEGASDDERAMALSFVRQNLEHEIGSANNMHALLETVRKTTPEPRGFLENTERNYTNLCNFR